MSNFQQLREYLHRDGEYDYVWTSESKRSYWTKTTEPATVPTGNVNCYFSVHPSRILKDPAHRATIADVPVINGLFAEFDIKQFSSRDETLRQIRSIPIKPSCVVASGYGYHCYFFLREPYAITDAGSLTRARQAQSAWVKFTHGDTGAKDIARVLRVPDSFNYKYNPPRPVRMIFSDWTRQSELSQFEDLMPVAEPRVERVLSTQFGTSYIETALRNEADRIMRAPDGARNDTLNKSAFSLGRLLGNGISQSRIEGILLGAALAAGLSEREAELTIRSGLASGGKG